MGEGEGVQQLFGDKGCGVPPGRLAKRWGLLPRFLQRLRKGRFFSMFLVQNSFFRALLDHLNPLSPFFHGLWQLFIDFVCFFRNFRQ
jgi:hypothetical protein